MLRVMLKLAQWSLRRWFLNILNRTLLFRYYLPLKKAVALHLNKLESPLPKDVCAKFGWNWPSGSREGDFLKILWIQIYYFAITSTWRRAWPFIWTILNSLYPSIFLPSLFEIGPVVLERKAFKYFEYKFSISLLSHIGEGRGLSYEQTWIPSTQGGFVPSLV